MGMPNPERISALKRNRWQEVTRSSFGGLLRPYFSEDKDHLTYKGQVCMAVPKIIHSKLKRNDKRDADAAKANHERAHSTEGISVPGGSHESALAHNRHGHSYSPYNPEQKVPD
jgi:ribosomal protein L32